MAARVGLALIIAAGLVWLVPAALREARQAPNVEFTTITGERGRLADFRGHPVLVTFWASDCRVCLSEIAGLGELHREFSGDGFQLLAIAMDYDVPSRVVDLVRLRRLPYRVVLDSSARLATAFERVKGVPTTFLIAPDGDIRYRVAGEIDFVAVRGIIRTMLGES